MNFLFISRGIKLELFGGGARTVSLCTRGWNYYYYCYYYSLSPGPEFWEAGYNMRPYDLGRLRYNNIRGRRLARGIRFIYGNGLTVVNKNTCLPSWAATPLHKRSSITHVVRCRFTISSKQVARENHSYDRHTCLPARTSRRVFFTTVFVRR